MITLMFVFLTGTAFASERNYVLTKEYTYESLRASGAITSGFVEILIGNVDFVQYQDDNELVITPLPDEIRHDDLGNVYAYFDLSGLRPKQDFKITVYDKLHFKQCNSHSKQFFGFKSCLLPRTDFQYYRFVYLQ